MQGRIFPVLVLALDALAFGVTGCVFLFGPMSPLSTLGVESLPGPALTDIRAAYGGIELGIAGYLFVRLARMKELQDPLLLATLILGGMVVTRFYGMVVDGSAVRITIVLLTVEGVGAVLSGAAWWQARRTGKG